MLILGIDPGYQQSAFLLYYVSRSIRSDKKQIMHKVICPNYEGEHLLLSYYKNIKPHCVIEMPECFGMPVGKTVLDTCRTIGRFEMLANQRGMKTSLIYRSDIKLHLCNSKKARDSNIRQALIDKFGGSREKAIGTKKSPGPLYGVSKDLWQALAICVTYAENKQNEK